MHLIPSWAFSVENVLDKGSLHFKPNEIVSFVSLHYLTAYLMQSIATIPSHNTQTNTHAINKVNPTLPNIPAIYTPSCNHTNIIPVIYISYSPLLAQPISNSLSISQQDSYA